jgi:hypothetical protein
VKFYSISQRFIGFVRWKIGFLPRIRDLTLCLMLINGSQLDAGADGKTDPSASQEFTRQFRASNLTGSVWTRSPHGTGWFRVGEGQHLREGQLIQVAIGAAVTFTELEFVRGTRSPQRRIQLRISQPMIARLASDMLRPVRLNTYVVNTSELVHQTSQNLAKLSFDWKDSWQRLSVILTGRSPVVDRKTLETLAKEGMALVAGAKPLNILSPVSNTLLTSQVWPIDTKVIWRHPQNESLDYYVYIWPAGSQRGSPLGSTREDSFNIQLMKPGIYVVQVTSHNGEWQSPGLVLHGFTPPKKSITAQDKAILGEEDGVILTPKIPGENTTIIMDDREESIDFAWEYRGSPFHGDLFHLVILDQEGRVIFDRQTRSQQLEVVLAAGRYRWFVQSLSGGRTISSSERMLEMVDGRIFNPSKRYQEIIKRALSEKSMATILFTGGL